MYNKIYDFCKVRNKGNVFYNSPDTPTPRVNFLLSLLQKEGINYELDKFISRDITCYNIILKGNSSKMVCAHHDIVNPNIDNANDNSASVINAIMLKKLMPNINVVLVDGEEFGGIGSRRVSEQINSGHFGKIDWVLNLELTGKGGEAFFIGDYNGNLKNHIKKLFDCPTSLVPFNDSVIFRENKIDSVVINTLPILPLGKKSSIKWKENYFLDYNMLFNCHTNKDSLDTICVKDMQSFVEKVLVKILT